MNSSNMNNLRLLKTLGIALMLGVIALGARAGDGHDHGDAPPGASGPALPRFAAVSDLFELVGVLDGKRLRLYLDHAPDNRPVKDAKLEVEFGGSKLPVEPHGDGEFEATLSEEPKEGVFAVTATVVAGSDSDLLAGELDIHHEESATAATTASRWKSYAAWGAAVLAALALVGYGTARLRARRVVGGAA